MYNRFTSAILLTFLLAINAPGLVHCQSSDSIMYLLSHDMLKDDANKFDLLCILASNSVDPDTIVKYSEQAIALADKLDINPVRAYIYMGWGSLNSGKLASALECFMKAADYYKSDNNYLGMADTYNYIAETYNQQQNYNNAIYYLKSAVDIFSKENDSLKLALALHNLGYTNYSMERYDTALVLYAETGELFIQLGYVTEYAFSLGNIGLVYSRQEEYQKAEEYLLRAIKILEDQDEMGHEIAVTEYMIEYAGILQHKGEIGKAISYATESFAMASANNILEFERDAALRLSRLFQISGKYDSAYHYQSIYINANDSINSVQNIQKMADLRTEFEVAKKQAEVEVLEKNRLIQIIVIIGLGLILLLAIGLIFMYSYNLKRSKKLSAALDERRILLEKQGKELKTQHEELKHQNNEIEAQHKLVLKQKNQIEIHSKEITDSINYAKRIQSAVLPSSEILESILPEHFVLFKPRDIVSGDFYWIKQIKNFTVVVAADCTGHGVPGAFMSMLGVSMLNEIVGKSRLDSAGEFLDRLRKKVKNTLSQEGKELEQKDGMDLALAIFDSDNNDMQFAGAFNPIYLIRNNDLDEDPDLAEHISLESEQYNLYEIKGDRQPISIYSNEIEFKTHYVKLEKNDTLYMFSDGYQDQIGGPNEKKFMVRKFKALLLGIQNETMHKQKEILNTTLEEWKKAVKQIDDILVLGIRW